MRKRIFLPVFLLAVLLGLFLFAPVTANLPSFQEIRAAHQQSEAVLLDRHHEVIHELRINPKGRRLDWVALEDMSPALRAAIIHAEDRRFYNHGGVDWSAFGSALAGTVTSATPRGASTITMQLASHLTEKHKSDRRSLWQKLKQIQSARVLEANWRKAEILEAYLNLVSFRGELQGIAAASRALFGKKPHGLDCNESVILAALLRAPNASVELVASRASTLANALNLPLGDLSAQAAQALSGSHFVKPEADFAPHVAIRLLGPHKARTGKTRIISTLDGRLQRFAIETLRRQLLSVRGQNVQDGAVLVVDNKEGEVLAYVGNVPDLTSARYVDGIQAQRQAGSTLKPFLYGLAFEERLATAASLLDDNPTDIPVQGGIYRPRNYDNHFHGLVTARVALASSLNVPAVKTLSLVGVGPFLTELRQVGFRNLKSADFYGPSLALGSADVTLWDLVNAYRCLANNGLWSELRLIFDREDAPTQRRALSEDAAFLVSDILSDRESRSRTFSLESPLATRFWTAVKTGTSKDMRDNWCVGYSNRFTIGVWVGNFSGEPMWNISGIAGAAPVWVEIMNWLHRDQPNHPPAAPAGLVAREVELPDSEQRRREWFLKGTETQIVRQATSQTNFRIVQPSAGTVVALDPDIPGEQQKLFFESNPKDSRMRWVLNGEDIGFAGSGLLWSPVKGKHILLLVDPDRKVLDTVLFEVRGNPAQ